MVNAGDWLHVALALAVLWPLPQGTILLLHFLTGLLLARRRERA